MKIKSLVKIVTVLVVLLFSMSLTSAAGLMEKRQHVGGIFETLSHWGLRIIMLLDGTSYGIAENKINKYVTNMDRVAGSAGFSPSVQTNNVGLRRSIHF